MSTRDASASTGTSGNTSGSGDGFGPVTRSAIAQSMAAIEHVRAADAEARAADAEQRARKAEADAAVHRDRADEARDHAEGAWVRAGALQERLRDKALLLGEFDHKLKTSFAVISGYATLLERDWHRLEEQQRLEAVATIRRRSDEVVAQAAALLADLSAELDVLESRPVHLDLAALVQAIVEHHQGATDDHTLRYRGPSRLMIDIDPHAVETVLAQLVENSRKYAPRGTQIVVTLAGRTDRTEITVDDQGPGIPEGVDVFAPFTRGTQAVAGSGLGLYMARRVADAIAAKIHASNNPEGGARFVVDIPYPAGETTRPVVEVRRW